MKVKKINSVFILLLILTSLSCSNSDDDNVNENINEDVTEYAMTAKINGVLHQMNNPFGTNEATSSIYSYYPNDQYIMLQGRFGGVFGTPEIDIWINRNDLEVGVYPVDLDTNAVTTHIDLIDNSNDVLGEPVSENTVSGFISIDFIDLETKKIRGTFEFNTIDGGSENDPINFRITEGTFNYVYDVE
ncbi:hypothetical protein [Aquimarina rhabdastrellae]